MNSPTSYLKLLENKCRDTSVLNIYYKSYANYVYIHTYVLCIYMNYHYQMLIAIRNNFKIPF